MAKIFNSCPDHPPSCVPGMGWGHSKKMIRFDTTSKDSEDSKDSKDVANR